MFDVDDGKQKRYTLVYAENKSLVGVLDTVITPPQIVILFDFTDSTSWPSEYAAPASPAWRSIFLRLQQENPQLSMPLALKE
jgi:hypothetical protein